METQIYWKNLLYNAINGLGDGDPRVTGSIRGSNDGVDTNNKRFHLEFDGILHEFGPAGDDNRWNGHTLYFEDTDNKYSIVEFENKDGTGGWATVSEVPYSGDIGNWKILKTLYENNTRDYPTKNAGDWDKSRYWKAYNANTDVDFYIFAHNYINNGGFEYTSGANQSWTKGTGWHFCDATKVNSQKIVNVPIVSHYLIHKTPTQFRTNPAWGTYPFTDTTANRYDVLTDGTVNVWFELKKVEFLPKADGGKTWDSTITEELHAVSDTTVGSADYIDYSGMSMLGQKCMKFTGRSDGAIYQNLNKALSKDKQYVISFKYKYINYVDSTRGMIRVRLTDLLGNPIDDTYRAFYPDTTSHSIYFISDAITPDHDFSAEKTRLYVQGLPTNTGAQDATFVIDEIYINETHEIEDFIVLLHNWDGATFKIYGCYADPARTHFDKWSEDSTCIMRAYTQIGDDLIHKSFTPAQYPVYHFRINAKSGLTPETPVMFLGPKIIIKYFQDIKFDPYRQETESDRNISLGGKIYEHPKWTRRKMTIPFWIIEDIDDIYSALKRMYKHVGNERLPVLVSWDTDNHSDDVILARTQDVMDFPYHFFSESGNYIKKGKLIFEEQL